MAKRTLLYWYEYGFAGAIEQAAKMERKKGIEFLGQEVTTFVKCDPNYLADPRPDQVEFIMNFTMYLIGRLDERREAGHVTDPTNWDPAKLKPWQDLTPAAWDTPKLDNQDTQDLEEWE